MRPALLCDIGNVIVGFDFQRTAHRLAAQSSHTAESILQTLHPLKVPLEDGQIDDTTFIREAIATIGFQGSADEFRTAWCEIFHLNLPLVATFDTLPTELPLYLLSNTSGLHKDYLFATYPIFNRFQDGIYSHLARTSKPGRRIFEMAIEHLRLDPTQTFYIDDLADNIATAASLGFVTHHYDLRDHQALDLRLGAWIASLD